ncbi:MAG: ankyrin repeat domain-containing protein [Bacteroidales bacterium]|nr:ankyrin repeat domain-containing protein [Bacteroidales bacterium]
MMFLNMPTKVKWAFALPFFLGITLGLVVLGLSVMIFDQDVDFHRVRLFCLVGFFLLYFVPASLLFLYLYHKTSKWSIALLAYFFPFLMEFLVYLYFMVGFFPAHFLPANDFRHFRGSPSFDIVTAIHFDFPFSPSDTVSLNYQDTVSGMTPLLFAIRNGKYEQARRLVLYGADPNISDLHTHKSPLLELCSINGDTLIPPEKVALIEALLDHKADANYSVCNQSPLFALCASDVRNPVIYDLLIDHGADVNAQFVQNDEYLHECYKENETALNMAIYRGNYDIALHLLQRGADTTMYGEWMKDVIRIKIQDANTKGKEKAIMFLKQLESEK